MTDSVETLQNEILVHVNSGRAGIKAGTMEGNLISKCEGRTSIPFSTSQDTLGQVTRERYIRRPVRLRLSEYCEREKSGRLN